MVQLPDVSSVTRVSSSVLRTPALRGPNTAQEGRALEIVGDVTSQVGAAFQKAERERRASQAVFEATKELQDKGLEIRASGDFANAVTRFGTDFKSILNSRKDSINDSGAFAVFSDRMQKRFLSARASMATFARTKQIEAGKFAIDNTINQSLQATGQAENVENPILFGANVLGPVGDALQGGVDVGVLTAAEASTRRREFQTDVRKRAVLGFVERSPNYLKAFRALESGQTGNENLDSLLGEMTPEERIEVKRSSLKALNERRTLDRTLKEENESRLESIADGLEVRFFTTDDPVQRGEILGQLEALATVTGGVSSSGTDIKSLRDFHAAAGLEGGARDDPDVVKRLQAGLISGELVLSDVLKASPSLEQETMSQLMAIANTQRNRRTSTGARIIRNSFGILKDTVISDRASRTVAQAAGDALVLYDQILANPDNKEDPIALATRLAKQGEETIRQVRIRNAISSVDLLLSRHGISIKGFDLNNRTAFEQQLKDSMSGLSQSERARLATVISGQINVIFGGN